MAVLYFYNAKIYSLFSDGLVRHQFIELCILRKGIGEWNNVACAANQPAARGNIGDIAKLVVGNVQQLRQFRAVGGALVQHHEKL